MASEATMATLVTMVSPDTTPSALPPSNPPPASTLPTNPSLAPAGSERPKPTPLSCTLVTMALMPDILTTDTDTLDTPMPMLDTTVILMPTANPPPVSTPPTNPS